MARRDERRALPATLESVAAVAGVSRATASRALTGSPKVSDKAREAVLKAAEQLSYVPNRAARSLVTRRSDSIAYVVVEQEERFFSDPYFATVLRGAHREIAGAHLQVLFIAVSSQAERDQLEQFAGGGHVDGAIIVSLHGDDPLPHTLEKLGVPVVLSGRPPVDRGGIRYVDADNKGGAVAAVRHLLGLGRSRIATIAGPADMAAGQDRLAGYRAALETAGLPVRPELVVVGDFSMNGGEVAMERLLAADSAVDGLFVANDLMAVGALRALERHGRSVPSDVAIIGFDDVPVAQMARPTLTTIRQPMEQMGREMARVLLDVIEGRPTAWSVVLPTEVVRRQSA